MNNPETAAETSSRSTSALGDALMLAILPIVGYWFSYLYEHGYCTRFDLPKLMIELDLPMIFSGALGALSVFFFIWIFADTAFEFLRGRINRTVAISLAKASLAIGFVLAYGIIKSFDSSTVIFMLLLFGGTVLFVEFILPILSVRGAEGYVAKLEAQHKYELSHETLTDRLASRATPRVVLGIVALYFASIGAWVAGGLKAAQETEFWVVENDREAVVLRNYGDRLLARFLCDDTSMLSNEMTIIVKNHDDLRMSNRRLGRLAVVEVDDGEDATKCFSEPDDRLAPSPSRSFPL